MPVKILPCPNFVAGGKYSHGPVRVALHISLFPFPFLLFSCLIEIFTVRKQSCRKVIFLHLSVSYSVHRGHAWQGGLVSLGVHDRGVCMVGDMYGGEICTWGMYGGGMWQGACRAGVCAAGVCAWHGRSSLKLAVRIILECILVSIMFSLSRLSRLRRLLHYYFRADE